MSTEPVGQKISSEVERQLADMTYGVQNYEQIHDLIEGRARDSLKMFAYAIAASTGRPKPLQVMERLIRHIPVNQEGNFPSAELCMQSEASFSSTTDSLYNNTISKIVSNLCVYNRHDDARHFAQLILDENRLKHLLFKQIDLSLLYAKVPLAARPTPRTVVDTVQAEYKKEFNELLSLSLPDHPLRKEEYKTVVEEIKSVIERLLNYEEFESIFGFVSIMYQFGQMIDRETEEGRVVLSNCEEIFDLIEKAMKFVIDGEKYQNRLCSFRKMFRDNDPDLDKLFT